MKKLIWLSQPNAQMVQQVKDPESARQIGGNSEYRFQRETSRMKPRKGWEKFPVMGVEVSGVSPAGDCGAAGLIKKRN